MYTREQVIEKSTEYFNGDTLAATVFADKYALSNGDTYFELTPDDMHKRLAKEFARIEQKYPNPMSEDEIYDLVKNFGYVVPQGSPMAAVGNPYQIQSTSNCFVIDAPEDSYGGICKTDQELVQLAKRRSGIGFDISKIRPKGLKTNNAAKSTDGIGIFMERFSNSCREVAQNGRRGALLLSLDVRHPEIETFINIKKDKKKVTGANVSVILTDDFMEAVKNDTTYEQQWPINSQTPVILKTVNARDIWKQIIHNAWEGAEPGLLFWGNVEKNTPSNVYENFKAQSTNPCQTGWAKVITKNGIKKFDDVSIGDYIWSKEGWTKIINKWSTGIKDVYKINTTIGPFYSTDNHRVISNGKIVELKDAKTIDICVGEYDKNVEINLQDVMDGLVIGDGSVHKASNDLVYFISGEKDGDYFNDPIKDYFVKYRPGIKAGSWEVKTTIKSTELPKTFERKVPDRFLFGNRNKVVGFLRGLFSANGSISGERVTLKATSFNIIEDVLCMLSSLGIRAYYSTNKTKSQKFSNGTYQMKESYDINITTDRDKFYELIGFIHKYKMDKLKTLIDTLGISDKGNKKSYEIKSYELFSTEEVFDITVDNNSHTYWSFGKDTKNCGEIVLGKNDSCRLISLNLLSYVDDKYLLTAKFNYEKFSKYVIKAQRMMDDLIDLELESIDNIIAKIISDPEPQEIKFHELNLWKNIRITCENGRRCGLGITALGDTLASIGIKYGSKESVEVVERIYKELELGAYSSSIKLAEERGAFPEYDYNLEKNHDFLSKVISNLPKQYQDLYKKYGRRNIALTTTAPNGTVSLMTQTSSGIEPVFKISYTRRKKMMNSAEKPDFVDAVGDRWQEYKVYHHQFLEWSKITGKDSEEDSPWFGATANDIDWEVSVDLQAAAQRWIDHSISRTCNLPNTVSEETVATIYMKAWESGCKGFTVYRDGCRDGVLITNDNSAKKEKPSEQQSVNAPKRQKILDHDVYVVTSKGKKYIVSIGKQDGKLYEIFGGLIPENLQFKFSHKPGKMTKLSQGHYTLEIGEDILIKNFGDIFTAEEQMLFRMISTSLRHGIPVKFIVQQLAKSSEDISSLTAAVGRVLKKYIQDGDIVNGSGKCPVCGNNLIYLDGCVSCSCGFSKC